MIFNYSFSYKHFPFNAGNQPVSVIVTFATDGRFKPIYFKYITEDDTITFKIDGIHYTRDKHDCILFCCFITHNDVRHEVNLIFKTNECIWMLEAG